MKQQLVTMVSQGIQQAEIRLDPHISGWVVLKGKGREKYMPFILSTSLFCHPHRNPPIHELLAFNVK